MKGDAMKKRKKKSVPEWRWTDLVRRVKGDDYGSVRFYVRGSRPYHFSNCGYTYGHEVTDFLVACCEAERFPCKRVSSGSPGNVDAYERYYRFFGGGLALYSGNYFCGEPSQGTYLYGFRALRWALDQLCCPQPRKLKGEARLRLAPPLAARVASKCKDASASGR